MKRAPRYLLITSLVLIGLSREFLATAKAAGPEKASQVETAASQRQAFPKTIVEVSVLEFGPEMPRGPATVVQLLEVGPTVYLDEHLLHVDVVHSEVRDVQTKVDGKPQIIPERYYFVRVPLSAAGSTRLRELQAEADEKGKQNQAGSIRISVRIAASEQATQIFFDRETERAELRFVLHEPQLLTLLTAVRQSWQDTQTHSTINLWQDGLVDVPDPVADKTSPPK